MRGRLKMCNWEEIKNLLTAKGLKVDVLEKTKKETDQINFTGIYKCTENQELFLPSAHIQSDVIDCLIPDDVINQDGPVYNAFKNIQKILADYNQTPKEKKHYIGTISNGSHSLDFMKYYFPLEEIQKTEWISCDKKVMFLFEAPANNLDASCGYQGSPRGSSTFNYNNYLRMIKQFGKNDQAKFMDTNVSLADFTKRLSSVRWWIDGKNMETSSTANIEWWNDTGLEKCMSMSKMYGHFIAAAMRIFGLSNIYATNLMRFELFEEGIKKEQSLNWAKASDIPGNPIRESYQNIFLKELNAFQPDVILATANPYYYMIYNNKDYAEKTFKILHPANYNISKNNRHCINICYIAKALHTTHVLSVEQAEKIIKDYYLLSDYAEKSELEIEE